MTPLRATGWIFVLALLAPRVAAAHEGRVQRVAKTVGFVAGVGVTGALALVKKWNAPLRDANGRPEYIQVGGRPFELRVRHAPVLGPKLLAKAATMPVATRVERAEHNLVLGLGEGATKAPLAEAKMEAKLAAALR
jgi:hypothetical protein